MSVSLIEQLQEKWRDVDLRALFDALLVHLYPIPGFSSLSKPSVHTVKTTTCGAFAIAHYHDPNVVDHELKAPGSEMVVLSKRPNTTNPQGPDMYACTGGGYMELGDESTAGEQPNEGAVRELKEETLNDQGAAILDIAPERLRLVKTGVDYRKPNLPTHFSGHIFEMTRDEYEAIKRHADRFDDPIYEEAVLNATNGEVTGYEVMPLSQALKLSPEQFAHPHELDVLRTLPDLISQRQARGTAAIG